MRVSFSKEKRERERERGGGDNSKISDDSMMERERKTGEFVCTGRKAEKSSGGRTFYCKLDIYNQI